MPRPNRNNNEKAKDFKGAIKRLLKELSGFKKIIILSLVLAALGSILTIFTPNILSDLTDEISEGLVVNQDNLQTITQNVIGTFNEDNLSKIMIFDLSQENLTKIMLDKSISEEEKII